MLQEGLSMIIYFANRFMEIAGMASTGLPDGLILQHDVKKIDVDSGVATFEGEVVYTNANRLTVKAMAAAGNYILRHHNSDYECYTIIETEDDTEKGCVYFYAEDAGLDLLNEIVGEYAASAAQPAAFYINRFTRDSGWEIGINEIEDLSRKLSWEGDATAAERVRSVATQFGAEIGYRFDIDKLQIRHKYIDIYEKRGRDTMYELRLGREIKRIVEKTSIADLVTCLRVTGGTPEGQNDPITLKGYTYDDGDIYIDQTYGDLKSRSALEVWSRYLSETGTGDGHIVGTYSYDTTSQQTLCSHAVTAIKERSQPAVNYEVELYYLPEELKIGDIVRIVDDRGELYLSARLLETEERVTDYQYHATFGDFLIKSSGISEKVQDLADKYADLAKTRTLYTWIVYADDAEGSGISTSEAGKAYIGIAPNRVVADPDLTDVSVYKWTRIEGIQGTQGIQGPTGADGTTYYVHFAYATSSDGSQGFSTTPFDGAVYIGTCTNTTQADSTRYQDYDWSRMKGEQGDKGQYATEVVTEYYLSTSNTDQSGGSWSTTPEAYVSGRYYWRRDKITWENPVDTTYTTAVLDNALNSANSTAATAKTTADTANSTANGKGRAYYQPTAPTEGTDGDVWFDTAHGNAIYQYGSSGWSLMPLGTDSIADRAVTDAKVSNLDAGSITTGTLNAIDITGCTFKSSETATDRTEIEIPIFDESGTRLGKVVLNKSGLTAEAEAQSGRSSRLVVTPQIGGSGSAEAKAVLTSMAPVTGTSNTQTYNTSIGAGMITIEGDQFSDGEEGSISHTHTTLMDTGIDTGGWMTGRKGICGPYIQATGTASSLAMARNTITQVPLGAVDASMYASDAGMTVTGGAINVAEAGLYRISGSVYIVRGSASAGKGGVYINAGSSFKSSNEVIAQLKYTDNNLGIQYACGPKIVSLSAGQNIYLAARCMSDTGECLANNPATFLLVERLT